MKNTRILFLLLMANCYAIISDAQTVSNSGSTLQKKAPVVFKSTLRFHTKGLFAYGGRICSDNPSADINFILEKNNWGFLWFKASDLVDNTTPNNFSLIVVYRSIKLTDNLTFTPYAGALLEQPHSFADHGSDAVVVFVTSYKPGRHFTLEHTSLMGNLFIEPVHRDWVNRLRALYSYKHIDITGYLWHNNKVFDENTYASGALTVAISRLKVSRQLHVSVGVTDVVMMQSSNETAVPTTNKIMLSAAVSFTK